MRSIKLSMFLSVFVAMVGLMIIAPVMPPLIRELGLSELHSGLIVSLGSVAMAIMSPLWGGWSDKLGRRPIILAGFAGMFVSYVFFTAIMYSGLQGWLSGGVLVLLLIVGRTLVGAFIPAVPAAAQAYIADVTDEQDRAGGMALLGAANGIGLVLGPAIAGVFALISLIWPLYIGALLPALAFIAVMLLVPKRKAIARTKPPRIHPLQSGLSLYLLAGMILMVCIVSMQVVGGFYFQDQLSLTTKETARYVSFALMICGVSMIAVQAVLMKASIVKPKQQLLWGALLLILSIVIQLLFSNLPLFFVAYFMFGLGAGLMMPAFMTGASLAVSSEQQGGIAGLVGMVQGVAAVIAPLLSTALYQLNKQLPYMLSATLLLVLCIVILIKNGNTSNLEVK